MDGFGRDIHRGAPSARKGACLELVPYGSAERGAPGCRPEALPLPEDLLREGQACAQRVIDPFARDGLKVAHGRAQEERGS